MLAVTLSTLVQTAKKEPLGKEYYTWTKIYLEATKKKNPKMKNVSPFLRHMEWFKKANNVEEDNHFHITPIDTSLFPTSIYVSNSEESDEEELEYQAFKSPIKKNLQDILQQNKE